MQLEEKLYTSTEVAVILGVSLRSVYRYLDEGKLDAEVKTATGRHRFTKQNILDFLYPNGQTQEKQKEAKAEASERAEEKKAAESKSAKPEDLSKYEVPSFKEEVPVEPAEEIKPVAKAAPVAEVGETVEEEPVDWLEKFRAAANKYREEETKKTEHPAPLSEPITAAPEKTESISGNAFAVEEREPEKEPQGDQSYYYRSLTGGLKDIAQNIDKSSRKASVDYAFTLNAGMSLHKPIKPFSVLHVYIRPEDREFYERMLHLVPAEENNAQLCLLSSKNKSLFDSKKEMHGLYVVSDAQLKKDLIDNGEEGLAREFDSIVL